MGIHHWSIYGVIRRNARLYQNRTALIWGQETVSYLEFREKVDRLAAGLHRIGVESGERIGILAKNGLAYTYLLGAAAKIGAILAPINWRLNPEEIAYILSDSSPKVCFVDEEFHTSADQLISNSGVMTSTFSTGAPNGKFISFDDLMDQGDVTPTSNLSHDDRYVLLYTAAVHGRPRAAVVTQQGLLFVSLQLGSSWGLGKKDVSLAVLPLFHVAGLLQVLSVMLAGGRNVVLPGFDADKAVKCIEEHQVTVFVEFPPMLSKIMAKAEEGGRKLSSIRHVLGIDQPELVKRFQDATGATFWASYGQSETSGLVTVGPYFERLGSTGLPLQLIEVEVVGDSGNILERGASGEIVVRGPHVFKGYWNKDADTRYTFRDGWHHTGDMGHIDEDGYLWFEGRAEEKELIKPGGENVYPAEVEKVVMECPAVQEVVVIGVPDPTWGEAIKAVCVLVPGSSLSEGDVIEFVAARIARFKKPKHVVFVDDLPKTSDGKLDRATIKAQHGKA